MVELRHPQGLLHGNIYVQWKGKVKHQFVQPWVFTVKKWRVHRDKKSDGVDYFTLSRLGFSPSKNEEVACDKKFDRMMSLKKTICDTKNMCVREICG